MLSSHSIHEYARPWLTMLEELQDLGIPHAELPVPQIAVFGDQSSGKSSLLESISGIPFPKGTGLVTKCPTRITMVNAPSKVWQATITLPSKIQLTSEDQTILQTVYSPTDLTALLERASTIITSKSMNGFSSDSIHVCVESAQTPDLSLVDLPGIIRTTTAGQDRSVISEVDELLRHYMIQQETVILAVIPANQDIATVDILERAAKLDPQGERTIGVLTKPDLVDKGAEEEILHIIRNVRKPLRLGYVIVKNRNQAELKSSLSLENSLVAEDEYFQHHQVWKNVERSVRGTKSLCNKLTGLIVKRAMDVAPIMQLNLQERLKSLQHQLTSLGMDVPLDDHSKRKLLIRTISRLTQTLRQIAAGDYRDPIPQHNSSLRLKYIVNETLASLQKNLKQKIPDFEDEAYAVKLSDAILNMKGRELPGFGSTRLLLSTVAEELDSWRSHIEETIATLFETYQRVGRELTDKLTMQYPGLNNAAIEILSNNVSLQIEIMHRRVMEMFTRGTEGAASDQELILSINEIRFKRFDQALIEVLTVAKEVEPGKGNKEDMKAHMMDMLGHAYMHYHSIGNGPNIQVEEARAVLGAYWKICEKRISEDVTSSVDIVILQQCSEMIEKDLLEAVQIWLADHQLLNKIFSEDPKITLLRQETTTLIDKVRIALSHLDELLSSKIGM